MGLPILDDSNFATEVLDAQLPVVVDFMAEWCAPCKTVAQTLETLAPEYSGRVKFVKVDIDRAPETTVRYSITAVPQVFVFKNGQVAERLIGGQPERKFRALIDGTM